MAKHDFKTDLLQGTLDMLILRVLSRGEMQGWGIADVRENVASGMSEEEARNAALRQFGEPSSDSVQAMGRSAYESGVLARSRVASCSASTRISRTAVVSQRMPFSGAPRVNSQPTGPPR